MLPILLKAKAVAAFAAAAISAGGAAAAATGTLPAPVQQFAHHTLHAPAPHQHRGGKDGDKGRPSTGQAQADDAKGPDPTGPAKYGLCRAASAGQADRSANKLDAVAFQALAKAAGGAAKVTDYCDDASPGKAADHQPAATTRGQPASGHRRHPDAGRHRSRLGVTKNAPSKGHTPGPDDTAPAHASGYGHHG
jgi:hypothetical protein